MRSIAANVLFTFVAQACATELIANRTRDAQDSMSKLANMLADKLASRLQEQMINTITTHQRELDNTALEKPGHLVIPRRPTMDVSMNSCSCCKELLTQNSQSLPPARLLSDVSKSSGGIIDWVYSWFKDMLGYLGLSSKTGKIIFLGLDNAGKTTLMHMLKESRLSQFEPTMCPNSEDLSVGNIKFRAFDLGGHKSARQLWKDYFVAVDGIIFLVDSNDRARFPEVAQELWGVLREPYLSEVPVAILANKIDIPTAATEDELRQSLGVPAHYRSDMTGGKKPDGERPVGVFMCSVAKRMGYAEAFRWLGQYLK